MYVGNTYTRPDSRVVLRWKQSQDSIISLNSDGEKLGRPLEPYEVHHINGNPQNNDLANLEVVQHGEHQKAHNPCKYKDKEAVM